MTILQRSVALLALVFSLAACDSASLGEVAPTASTSSLTKTIGIFELPPQNGPDECGPDETPEEDGCVAAPPPDDDPEEPEECGPDQTPEEDGCAAPSPNDPDDPTGPCLTPPQNVLLITPTNGSSGFRPNNGEFTWVSDGCPKRYVVQVSASPGFESKSSATVRANTRLPIAGNVHTRSYSGFVLFPNTRYYWRVKSSSALTGTGAPFVWSNTQSFWTGETVPELDAPNVSGTVQNGVARLTWGSIPDATGYRVKEVVLPGGSASYYSVSGTSFVGGVSVSRLGISLGSGVTYTVQSVADGDEGDWSGSVNYVR